MRFLISLVIFCLHSTVMAKQWHKVDPNTFIIAPAKKASQYQANQAILVGKTCAAVINSHGDFSILEHSINQIKQRINLPVCYLISTSSNTSEVLGMAILQRAFPSAKWIAPQYVQDNFNDYQAAYQDKIATYSKSYQVSTQHHAQAKHNSDWKNKLHIAQQRILDWQSISLKKPVSLTKQLSLGAHTLYIEEHKAATQGDLFVYSNINKALFAGLSVEPIPHVTHTNIEQWQQILRKLHQDMKISWLLPSHGRPYQREALKKPIAFLEAVKEYNPILPASPPKLLTTLYSNNQQQQTLLTQLFQLALHKVHNLKRQTTPLSSVNSLTSTP